MTATSPATPEQLFARLDQLGIRHRTQHHRPVFTVAEAQDVRDQLPGGHCKNLFLKDKKGRLFLVVCQEDRPVDLKRLRKALGAQQLSFGKPELLFDLLGVTPGAVTPFALINDTGARVRVILDASLMDHELVNFHPLENNKTTQVSPDDLKAFITACGHAPEILDFDALAQQEADQVAPEQAS